MPGMSMRRRGGAASVGVDVSAKPVGNALVVHRTGAMTESAQALAMALAQDPDHDLVVVDLLAELPISVWEQVASLLPRRRRGVRLVMVGRSRETVALVGHLLAGRLGRTVAVPDGAIIRGAGGSLFVHSGPGSGWVVLRPGRPHRPDGKHFPPVSWERDAFDDIVETSSTAEVEPLPGGLWLRPIEMDDDGRWHRTTLTNSLAVQPDVLTVVIGCPGGPAVSTDDVARLWMLVPEDIRPKVKFTRYGSMNLLPGKDFGSTIAELIQGPVRCYVGLPVGDAANPDIVTVTPSGTPGWYALARELLYRPGDSARPEIVDHRMPLQGLPANGPATYWYAPDAVVEVVPSGLLVRGPVDTADTERIRAAAPDDTVHRIVYDAPDGPGAARMRQLAQDLVNRLEETVRRASRVMSAGEIWQPKALPAISAAPVRTDTDAPHALLAARRTEVVYPPRARSEPDNLPGIAVDVPTTRLVLDPEPPPTRTEAIRPAPAQDQPTITVDAEPDGDEPWYGQPMPSPEASAMPPAEGIAKEREWLRKTLAAQFETATDAVVQALSEETRFAQPSDDVVTDAVMIQLYLSPSGTAVDDALRSGAVGPHVPIARSVVAGLRRMPVHSGAALYSTTMTADQAEFYRDHPVVTEWGIRHALIEPVADLPGDTDVLLWSLSARSTRILEPPQDGVPDRVLFLPGTRFVLLDVAEPTALTRGLVMLREMAPEEGDWPDDSSDSAVLDDLWDMRDEWADTEPADRLSAAAAARFTGLPGLAGPS